MKVFIHGKFKRTQGGGGHDLGRFIQYIDSWVESEQTESAKLWKLSGLLLKVTAGSGGER